VDQHDSGIVYKCSFGQRDGLAISMAMPAWADRHLRYDREGTNHQNEFPVGKATSGSFEHMGFTGAQG
jgi:hypothetical protein